MAYYTCVQQHKYMSLVWTHLKHTYVKSYHDKASVRYKNCVHFLDNVHMDIMWGGHVLKSSHNWFYKCGKHYVEHIISKYDR